MLPNARLLTLLRRPLVTEKTQMLRDDKHRVSVLEVRPDATKPEIKAAVETIFGVEVEKVHTLNFKGKTTRRTRYGAGRHSDWKKAYVKLAKGALDWDNLQASEEKPAAPEESKE